MDLDSPAPNESNHGKELVIEGDLPLARMLRFLIVNSVRALGTDVEMKKSSQNRILERWRLTYPYRFHPPVRCRSPASGVSQGIRVTSNAFCYIPRDVGAERS